MKDSQGIYRAGSGVFRILPPVSRSVPQDSDSSIHHDFVAELGERAFYYATLSRDTLFLHPMAENASDQHPQRYVRHYELQTPSWTRETQEFPLVRVTPRKDKTYEVAPEPIDQIVPAYPHIASEAGTTGEVQMDVLVHTDGAVIHVKTIKGVLGLNEASVSAARRWRFKPALARGKPVRAWVALSFHFTKP